MIDEQDVEDLLRCYRPAGPPADLRQRCLAPDPMRAARAWPWAVAAAILLAASVSLHVLSNRSTAVVDIGAASDDAAPAVVDLTQRLGDGSNDAQVVAERIVLRQQFRDAQRRADLEAASDGSEETQR